MKLLNQNLGRLWSSIIVNELVRQGSRDFFISPGQRNAPLIAAIVNNPQSKIHVGIDERAQGYRALGFSKSCGIPGVLVCTSGTALSNYMPAVIEAKKSQTPLIIISADRPWDMVYANANQTIVQDQIFGNFVNAFLNPGEPSTASTPSALASSVAHLFFQSQNPIPGPVHLNLPLREPLENDFVHIEKDYLELAEKTEKRISSFISSSSYPNNLNPILGKIANSKSALLVVGQLPSYKDFSNIKNLLKEINWPFYLDICSGFKFEFNLSDGSTPGLDHPEVLNTFQNNPPELILHLGGSLVSKHYYAFLQKNPNIAVVRVNNSFEKEDPAHAVNLNFICDPDSFAQEFLAQVKEKSFPKFMWEKLVEKKSEIIDNSPLTYPQVSKALMDWIPELSTLYIGNSTAIRSFDSYSSKTLKKRLKILHHRGVSGIEGFLAAAVGASELEELPLTLVIGDISFLYDLNSLMLFKEAKNPIITLILNNKGGGIFSLLPIAAEKEVIPYLYTGHDLEFKKVAEQFNLNYKKINDINGLKEFYLKALADKTHTFIEVEINNDDNVEIYKKLKTIKL
jgi:2-succinyl-5-enolpyruvyl-6-hydroxy-3-cyclohexene-1-carboxylate synthase